MITSSGVPTPWNGAFISKGKFADKFKVVDKNYNEIFDRYEVTITYRASPNTKYVYEVSEEIFNGSKDELADEIQRQRNA